MSLSFFADYINQISCPANSIQMEHATKIIHEAKRNKA